MEIKLGVSNEKNLEKLNKLTEDPAFILTLLKNIGYKKCPNTLCIKVGLFKLKEKNNDTKQ